MSEVRSDVDLSRLSRERGTSTIEPPRRSWRRWILPIAIVAGFAGLLAWSLGDALRPRVDVRVVHPKKATSTGGAGRTTDFAAAGWVEPDPYPLHVTPLTAGVLEEVLVEEGDTVSKGQPLARLVPDDAELDLRLAIRAVELARNAIAERAVALEYAKRDFDARIELDERLAVTQAELDGKLAERDALVASAQKLEADVEVASEELTVQRELRVKGAGGPRQVELAAARLASARSAQLSARAKAAHAEAQVEVAQARRDRVRRDAETRIEEKRRVAAADAALESAKSKLAQAEAMRAIAELRVARLIVRAPADGIVLERHIAPGENVGSDGIMSLYDPDELRIRVDVPQEQIAAARPGGSARILSEARPGQPYAGKVLRIVHKADIQKVTLEIQVRVLDPDELLRPEMLCQVRFEGAARATEDTGADLEGRVLLVPKSLVVDGTVWIFDPEGPRAKRRTVRSGATTRADDGSEWVEILEGLDPSDKILEAPTGALRDGTLVRVSGGKR